MAQNNRTEPPFEYKRPRTTFDSLPIELHCMILEHVIQDIDIDNPDDLRRWSCPDPENPSFDLANSIPVKPYRYYSGAILKPYQRLSSSVFVNLHPRFPDNSQWQAGPIIVRVPRRYLEIFESDIFRDVDLAFLGRKMRVEVSSLKVRESPRMVSKPDTAFESVIRDLLSWKQEIDILDERLHRIHARPANVTCFFPRLQRLNVTNNLLIHWQPPNSEPFSHVEPVIRDLHKYHTLTQQELSSIVNSAAVPRGVTTRIRRYEVTLHTHGYMSLTRIAERLALSHWIGPARYCVAMKCMAEGVEGWMDARVVYLSVSVDTDGYSGWRITAARVCEEHEFGDGLAVHVWAARGHFDL